MIAFLASTLWGAVIFAFVDGSGYAHMWPIIPEGAAAGMFLWASCQIYVRLARRI